MELKADSVLNLVIATQGGRIGVVGVYSGYCNHYNIGAFMEKGLTMAAGQVRLYASILQKRVDLHK